MRTFNIVSSEKGGAGKTTFGEALIRILRGFGMTVSAWDADGDTGSLSRKLMPKDESGNVVGVAGSARDLLSSVATVSAYDMRTDQRAAMIDSLDAEADAIVHDLPGGSLVEIKRIYDAGRGIGGTVEELKMGIDQINVIHVISSDVSSSNSVVDWTNLAENDGVADHIRHVVVINGRDGADETSFHDWFKKNKARKELLANGQLIEIWMPKISDELLTFLNSLNISIFEAANEPRVWRSRRGEAARWVSNLQQQILANHEVFGIPMEQPANDDEATNTEAPLPAVQEQQPVTASEPVEAAPAETPVEPPRRKRA